MFGGLDEQSSNDSHRMRLAGIVMWNSEFLTNLIDRGF